MNTISQSGGAWMCRGILQLEPFKLEPFISQWGGRDVDKKKGRYFYELAAMEGMIHARFNLGVMEGKDGNIDRA